MTNIRRYFQPGDICFLTHVTLNRAPILVDHFDLLWKSIDDHFDPIAWVVLPDHVHLLVENKSEDIASLTKKMKLQFSTNLRKRAGMYSGRVWQYRYWDHIIRNNDDMNTHIDYIHYNPVKHGLAKNPSEWEYSSFSDYVNQGIYDENWGLVGPDRLEGEYGE